jgi:hypothetical protein
MLKNINRYKVFATEREREREREREKQRQDKQE